MKENLREIEILRGFAIFTVLIFHVTCYLVYLPKNSPIVIPLEFLNNLFEFGVPLFVFLSGFVLSFRYNQNIKHYSIFQYYKKRFLSILPQYLIAAIVYMLYLKNYNILSIFNPSSVALHFWFIPLIINLYIFYPIINVLIHKFKNNLTELFVIFIIIQFVSIIIGNYFNLDSILYYIGYFIFGIYVYENYNQIKKLVSNYRNLLIFALLITISAIIQTYNYNMIYMNNIIFSTHLFNNLYIHYLGTIFYLFTFLFLLGLAINIKERDQFIKKIFSNLGKYSLGIYLYHIMFLYIFFDILVSLKFNKEHYSFFLILFLITFSSSILLTYLINLIPYHEYAIGKIRKYKKRYSLIIFENYILFTEIYAD